METIHAFGLAAIGFAIGWVLSTRASCSRCDRADARLPGGGYQPLPSKGGRDRHPPSPPASTSAVFACGHAVGNVPTCSCGSVSANVQALR